MRNQSAARFLRCQLPLWLTRLLACLSGLAVNSLACADEIISFAPPPARVLLSVDSIPPHFYDFTPDEHWAEPLDSYWLGFSNWVLGQQRTNAQMVQAFGEWADRTLAGSPIAVPGNSSYLRVGFATESRYRELAGFKPEARFRLDAPTVKEKLRLVIESESDELIPQSERRRSRQLTEDERTSTGATGALRYLSDIGDAINLSTDLGVRLRFPADAFWRTTARKQWVLDEHWLMIADQRFFIFINPAGASAAGWGSAGQSATAGIFWRRPSWSGSTGTRSL
ncbi:hypothetical protein [Marinobacter sp. X15-166B]|uniref:hypothetical protein n=1 Tax=Marinobacter sp. X15-166B TaxID=1897620 RepID=UPI000AF3D01D|nr:hypothetical protein [Marinobacter sp. X15-166B]